MYARAVTLQSLPPWPSRPALFLDLDGTLLEFAELPHAVETSRRYRALLQTLASLEPCAVAFVSGRPIREMDRLLAPYRFAVAGMHGNERRDAEGRLVNAAIDASELALLRTPLGAFAAGHEGTFLEDKGIGLALHYRARPELHPTVERLALSLAASLTSAFELLRGNHVVEFRPAGIDKGTAIAAFMRESPFAGRTPVFIGDDVTDEAGFELVNALGGESVKVNAGRTVAKWRLPDVDAVLGWLESCLNDQ